MEYKVIEFEKRDQIATITLNRPDRLNAWTMRMHIEYRHALKAADEDAHADEEAPAAGETKPEKE